jgi:hypothetical protein
LKKNTVRTHPKTFNLPNIAIDRKPGYRQLPGTFPIKKIIE